MRPFVCVLACGALLGADLRGQTPSVASGDLRAVVSAARTLITEGKPNEAIARLKELDASQPEVAHLLGVAFYHADQHQRAIELLRPLVSRFPPDSPERREIVQVLGLSSYIAGRFAEALPLLEETRAWASDNLELGYVLGQAYIQTRKPDEARAAIARTFGIGPESAGAHVITAQLMLRLEMESLAEAELKQALQKNPRVPRAHFLLGQMALFRGRLDEAVALSEQELAINPADSMALYQIGDAHVRASQWDAAVAALQRSLWLNPYFSGPYILLGRVYMKKSQPATAEGMLRRAIQYDPNNRSAHYLLGQLLQQLGREDEAKREFEIAERLSEKR